MNIKNATRYIFSVGTCTSMHPQFELIAMVDSKKTLSISLINTCSLIAKARQVYCQYPSVWGVNKSNLKYIHIKRKLVNRLAEEDILL